MKFACPSCAGRIGATKDFYGLAVPCPHCGKQIVVPGASTVDQKQSTPVWRRRISFFLRLGIFAVVLFALGSWFWGGIRGKIPLLLSVLSSRFSTQVSAPRVLSCRLVDCQLSDSAQQLLGLPDPGNKVLVVVRMMIPSRLVIPSATEYEAMQRNGAGSWMVPSLERCRWFDARKFSLVVRSGSNCEGLALCRFCKRNAFTGLSDSGWGTSMGEVMFSVLPNQLDKDRGEELEVCFAVRKEELTTESLQVRFAGAEMPVVLKP
jgi:hypothetical protein